MKSFRSDESVNEVGMVPLVRELTSRVWNGKYWIVAGAAIGSVIAIVIANTSEHRYVAEMVLAPQSSDSAVGGGMGALVSQLGGIGSLVGLGVGAESGEMDALATLSGRGFTSTFIRDYGLAPSLFPERWDKAEGKWIESERPPTDIELVDRFDGGGVRDIVEDRRTGLVTARVNWSDPSGAAKILEAMVDAVNSRLRTRAIEESRRRIDFLKEELEQSNVVEVRQAINSLLEALLKQAALANARKDYAFRVVDPMVVPTEHDYIWPRPRLMAALGCLLGGMAGFASSLVVATVFRRRDSV